MYNKFKTVLIRFPDGANKNCTYPYANYDLDLKNDDMVVIHTGHHGFTLAQIADANPKKPGKVQYGREIVAKVDFAAYEARKARIARAAQLKHSMDEKVQHLKQMAIYDMLAEKDPALKSLLSEYKTLIGEKPTEQDADQIINQSEDNNNSDTEVSFDLDGYLNS